jgi:hypothetical protein
MKYNVEQYSDVEVESTTIDTDITISKDSTSLIFQIFAKNMYSNPIGSIVREITSNCFDSHVEANVDIKKVPVLIKKTFDKLTNSHYISFIDYGVGMSPERIKNVFSVMFSSSKRQDENQIGAFGLGSKCPLAYRRSTGLGEEEYDNSYSIITNFSGIKYTYQIYDSNKCPKISEPIIEFTKEGNGTEVRIPVLERDIQTFKKEMVRQLYYFENVIFEGFVADEECKSSIENVLTNEYQIVKAKTFFFRGNDYSQQVHVCLGRVAYPIDYNSIGLESSDYRFPVAIRMNIGEISITPSRESLNYNESTIKVIKKKLLEVKAEITTMLSKQYESIVTLEDYFKVKNKFGILYMPNGNNFNVGEIIKQKDIDFSNFKYGFMKMPNDKQLFRYFFETNTYGKKPKKKRNSWRYSDNGDSKIENGILEGGYDTLTNSNTNLFHFDSEFKRKLVKQAWLKYKYATFYTITKNQIVNKFQNGVVSDLFHTVDKIVVRDEKTNEPILDAQGKEIPTPYMESLLELQEEYFEIVRKYCTAYNDVVVPEDYVESRKLNARRLSKEYKEMTIPVKIFGRYRSTERVKLDSLFKLHIPIFYGFKEESDELRKAKSVFQLLFDEDLAVSSYSTHTNTFTLKEGKQGVLFITISQGNLKYMQYCDNAHPVSEFKDRMLKRRNKEVIEYFQSMKFASRYNAIDDLYVSKEFMTIMQPSWADKVKTLQNFMAKQNKNGKGSWSHNEGELSHYFDIAGVDVTVEQQKYIATIEELEAVKEVNAEALEFIDVPWNLKEVKPLFWDILKKVLVY